jgi:transposase InsO family protein
MVNYLSKFIPNMSAKIVNIRTLLESKTEWQWNHEHAKEWTEIKRLLTTEPVLRFFDQNRETKVSTDASKGGLGAVLLQKDDGVWQPVAYASRAMTSAETRYAQIEKETLGLVFGCEQFHMYIYGKKVILETDHKPLIAISKKCLSDMPPRIQRFMLRLQKYDLIYEFTPGKLLLVADALSRAYPVSEMNAADAKLSEEVDVHVHLIRETIPVTKEKWADIAAETVKDPELQEVREHVKNGWETGKCCRPYYHFQEEITVVQGVLLKGSRVIIPHSMRGEMIKRVHEGHLGIEKSKRRARTTMYWPNMNEDIQRVVSKCSVCIKYRYKQQKESLKPHPVPGMPWNKVGADLFHLNGKDYLVIIDYLSNFPEVAQLSSTNAKQVITQCKSVFARHGIPVTMVTDNGPQFSSEEFRQFARAYEFDHITSSPYFPQSNGQAEQGVKTVKRLLKKALEAKEDPYLALLAYRSSPLECGLSPAELLMNRKLKTRLISVHDYDQSDGRWAKRDQRKSYNQNAKDLEHLGQDNTVRVRGQDCWGPRAKVLRQVAPRSFDVLTEQGHVYRRNRKDLLLTNGMFQNQDEHFEHMNDPEVEVEKAQGKNNEATTRDERPNGNTEPVRRSTRPHKPTQRYIEEY